MTQIVTGTKSTLMKEAGYYFLAENIDKTNRFVFDIDFRVMIVQLIIILIMGFSAVICFQEKKKKQIN